MKIYYVYLAANRNRTIYIGVTNNLARRMYEHKNKVLAGFTAKYAIDRLVYYEAISDINLAIEREKQLKGWLRHRKVGLIEAVNPFWEDLSPSFE